MKNYLLVHCYEGTPFFGWQKTKEGPSIEKHLQNALEKVIQTKISLEVASRTDRGVHAKKQIANFFVENSLSNLSDLLTQINVWLPPEIKVIKIQEVPLPFHPTLDAIQKEYEYYFCTKKVPSPFEINFSWHIPTPLNLSNMKKAMQLLIGKHDFSAFTNRRDPPHKNTTCHLADIHFKATEEEILCLTFLGDHFLYKMVRNLVGTLFYVGIEKITLEELVAILQKKDRKNAGVTAPAKGLFLKRIIYPDHLAYYSS